MTENEFSGATPEKLYRAVVMAGNEKDKLKARKSALAALLNEADQFDSLIHMAEALDSEWSLGKIPQIKAMRERFKEEGESQDLNWHLHEMHENLVDALKWQGLWPLHELKGGLTRVLENNGVK